ncbi:hypothetical protein WUBG_12146 [Wuchereria bancrofti]|uniref:Protein kinase domain-containing protein n=1 Tax=Wuchereria bancrofti TaxID=6293 RepID=J9EIT6_WUCBA|nr:hypothetical protein WUBG_12146 [Wuchereria bancrofti]
MRQEATREARLKFMKEARLMRRYEHKHVVRILGVAVHEHPLMIIMENCPGGSLLSYLRKEKGMLDQKLEQQFGSVSNRWTNSNQDLRAVCLVRAIADGN